MKSAVLGIVLLVLFCGGISAAQSRMSASNAKPAILGKVGIDQKIGAMVPASLPFKDESGQTVRLGKFFGNRPIVLVLVYYQCPMLCTLVLNDLLRTMRQMPDSVGKDYDVLTVSFDPRDTPELAAAKKKNYLQEYGRAGAASAGWHFLTGEQSSISELTKAVGFRYVWDPQYKVFVHASGIIVLTPQGKISRYFFGVNYDEEDLRLALTDASGGRTGGVVDSILLYCCYYNPVTGKYNVAISRLLKIVGAVLVLALGLLIWALMRRSRKSVGAA